MQFAPGRRSNAVPMCGTGEKMTSQCRQSGSPLYRKAALIRPLDPQYDLREPVLSLRLPIAPLSGGSAPPSFDGREQGRRVRVSVEAVDPEVPIATRKQCDALVWAASELTRHKNRGTELPDHLEASVGDILKLIGRQDGGSQIRWLHAALTACCNTAVEISSLGDDTPPRRFQLLRSAQFLSSGVVRAELDPWLAEEVRQERIVRISPAALTLGPVSRRIYSYAKGFVGRPEGAERIMSFWDAYDRSGSMDEPRKFRAAITRLERCKSLPDFSIRCVGRGPGMEIALSKGAPSAVSEAGDPDNGTITVYLDTDGPPVEPKQPPILEVYLDDFDTAPGKTSGGDAA